MSSTLSLFYQLYLVVTVQTGEIVVINLYGMLSGRNRIMRGGYQLI